LRQIAILTDIVYNYVAAGGARKMAQTSAKSGILRGDFLNDTSAICLPRQYLQIADGRVYDERHGGEDGDRG
ncbi:MAG: hypothetical protein J5518_11690, partial [Lachnospiraceae bacterium]|nr:hypothetical protein [Lachnospiraceae bacterium]